LLLLRLICFGNNYLILVIYQMVLLEQQWFL